MRRRGRQSGLYDIYEAKIIEGCGRGEKAQRPDTWAQVALSRQESESLTDQPINRWIHGLKKKIM